MGHRTIPSGKEYGREGLLSSRSFDRRNESTMGARKREVRSFLARAFS